MAPRTMDRCVSELDVALEGRTRGGARPEAELFRKLSTIVEACGWKQRNHPRMERLQKSLVESAVYPSEDITDMSVPLSATIHFRREKPSPPVMEFIKEKDLERFIAKNRHLFFAHMPDLRGSRHLAGGTLTQRQYPFGSSYVKPDLVFETSDRTLVVVEVKLGEPDDGAVAQLRKYLAAASDVRDRVRGLLITGKPRSRAYESVIVDGIAGLKPHRVDWIQYSIDMQLSVKPDAE